MKKWILWIAAILLTQNKRSEVFLENKGYRSPLGDVSLEKAERKKWILEQRPLSVIAKPFRAEAIHKSKSGF